VKAFPASPDAAKAQWTKDRGAATARTGPPRAHATPFPGATEKAREVARKNFLALIFCLMVGTAALPHILMRYYTTPSVREARVSVTWSLFFIFLLYFSAPVLAVLVKYEMYHFVVGSKFADLPDSTRVYCAHEYTQANARFALTVDPNNRNLRKRAAEIDRLRAGNTPTVPSTLGEERATNPFLRAEDPGLQAAIGLSDADPVAVFAETRKRKDNF